MEIITPSLLFTWAAYLSAAAGIATLITGILFFTKGNLYGKINDIASIIQMLFMLPLTVLFFQLLPDSWKILGILSTMLGVAGMGLAIYGQTLLVLERINFETSTKFFPAGAGIGLWLIGVCVIALATGQLPLILTWIGIAAGAGYIATVTGFLRGGQGHPLFNLGAFLLGIGYPVWAIWVGLLLNSGQL